MAQSVVKEEKNLQELSDSREDLVNDLKVIYDNKVKSKLKMATVALAAGSFSMIGRVALQGVPSVEPILPLAIGLGFYYNWKYGMFTGTSAFFISNFFVWGLQGPWTIFQCLGAVLGALTGDMISKLSLKPRRSKNLFFLSLALGTLAYEFIVNIGSLIYFPWGLTLGPIYFLAAVPFAVIHLFSSFGFGTIIYGCKDKLKEMGRKDKLEVFSFRSSGADRSDRYSILS